MIGRAKSSSKGLREAGVQSSPGERANIFCQRRSKQGESKGVSRWTAGKVDKQVPPVC